MKKFTFTLYRDVHGSARWSGRENAEVEIEAEDEDSAREILDQMDSDGDIEWGDYDLDDTYDYERDDDDGMEIDEVQEEDLDEDTTLDSEQEMPIIGVLCWEALPNGETRPCYNCGGNTITLAYLINSDSSTTPKLPSCGSGDCVERVKNVLRLVLT